MKTQLFRIILGFVFVAIADDSQARFVTLIIGGSGASLISSVNIGTNETAVVRGGFDGRNPGSLPEFGLEVTKDDRKFRLGWQEVSFASGGSGKAVIAGPATLTLSSGVARGEFESAFVTLEIIPESFPPDKTIVVPAGTGGANIILERSTDLIHWTAAAPGAYTNQESHLFFRIRADRIP